MTVLQNIIKYPSDITFLWSFNNNKNKGHEENIKRQEAICLVFHFVYPIISKITSMDFYFYILNNLSIKNQNKYFFFFHYRKVSFRISYTKDI